MLSHLVNAPRIVRPQQLDLTLVLSLVQGFGDWPLLSVVPIFETNQAKVKRARNIHRLTAGAQNSSFQSQLPYEAIRPRRLPGRLIITSPVGLGSPSASNHELSGSAQRLQPRPILANM